MSWNSLLLHGFENLTEALNSSERHGLLVYLFILRHILWKKNIGDLCLREERKEKFKFFPLIISVIFFLWKKWCYFLFFAVLPSFTSMFPFCGPFRGLGPLEAMVKEKEKSKNLKHGNLKAVTVIHGEN